MKMVEDEATVRFWMKCFITMFFHHAEVRKMREEEHVDICCNTRKGMVLLFSLLSVGVRCDMGGSRPLILAFPFSPI